MESTAPPSVAARVPTPHVGAEDKKMYRFSNQAVIWSYSAVGQIHSKAAVAVAPRAVDGFVYFGCDDSHVYAVRQGGTLVWKAATDAPVTAPVTLNPF